MGNKHTILLEPLTKIVTARVLAHSSITSILSRVVPKETSRTIPACPNFSELRSSNRGTIRPFVAMAISFRAIIRGLKFREGRLQDMETDLDLWTPNPIEQRVGHFASAND